MEFHFTFCSFKSTIFSVSFGCWILSKVSDRWLWVEVLPPGFGPTIKITFHRALFFNRLTILQGIQHFRWKFKKYFTAAIKGLRKLKIFQISPWNGSFGSHDYRNLPVYRRYSKSCEKTTSTRKLLRLFVRSVFLQFLLMLSRRAWSASLLRQLESIRHDLGTRHWLRNIGETSILSHREKHHHVLAHPQGK